jgi:hypothetical protein
MPACMTGLRRWVPLIDLDQGSSVPLALVFQLTDKLTPSDILNSFSKLVILDHVLDCQALDANHLVFVNNARTELMLVVSSPILNTCMDFGNYETGFVPVLRALLFLGMPPLRFCQSFLIFGKVVGIAHTFSARECDHGLNAKVETDHLIHDGKRLDVILYQNGDKVAVGTILRDRDRTGFGVFGQRSMPVDMQRLIHLSKREGLPIPFKGIAGIGSRLIILLFLECWVFGAALKEIDKGTIQMPQGLLNGDRRDICKPGILLLEIREQSSKIMVGEALSMLKIGSLTGRESPIVDKADTAKRLSKDDSLLIGRVEPVLVRPPDLLAHGLFALSLFLEMLFHGCQDLSIERPIVLFSSLFHLFQQMDRKPDGKSFHVVFHATIVASICNCIKRPGPCAPAPNKERAFYPHD